MFGLTVCLSIANNTEKCQGQSHFDGASSSHGSLKLTDLPPTMLLYGPL
jgi:hypothetical protein